MHDQHPDDAIRFEGAGHIEFYVLAPQDRTIRASYREGGTAGPSIVVNAATMTPYAGSEGC